MKKILTGGFLSLSGAIGSSILIAAAGIQPITAWSTPPGRFICTILDNRTAMPILFFLLLLVIGIILMVGSLIMETFSAKNHDKN